MNILMEEHGGSAAQSCPQGSALFSVSDENNAIVLVTLPCYPKVTRQPPPNSGLSQVLGALRGRAAVGGEYEVWVPLGKNATLSLGQGGSILQALR